MTLRGTASLLTRQIDTGDYIREFADEFYRRIIIFSRRKHSLGEPAIADSRPSPHERALSRQVYSVVLCSSF